MTSGINSSLLPSSPGKKSDVVNAHIKMKDEIQIIKARLPTLSIINPRKGLANADIR